MSYQQLCLLYHKKGEYKKHSIPPPCGDYLCRDEHVLTSMGKQGDIHEECKMKITAYFTIIIITCQILIFLLSQPLHQVRLQ